MCGWYCHPRNLRQAARRGPGEGGVSAIQQKLPVVDDAGTFNAGGGGGRQRGGDKTTIKDGSPALNESSRIQRCSFLMLKEQKTNVVLFTALIE